MRYIKAVSRDRQSCHRRLGKRLQRMAVVATERGIGIESQPR
jgi:hypothetical protein